MQYCLQLQAVAVAVEEQHNNSQQQQQEAAGQTGEQSSVQQPQESANAVASAVQPLAAVALKLQQELAVLSGQHKQLHAAATRVCGAFKAGGSIIQARAVELGAALQKHCAAVAAGGTARGGSSGSGSAHPQQPQHLPLVVAAAVVQHWNDVELLLAALHKTCETMLPPAALTATTTTAVVDDGINNDTTTHSNTHHTRDSGRQQTCQQEEGVTGPTAANRTDKKTSQLLHKQQQCGGGADGTAARRRAVKLCKRLVDGLQQLLPDTAVDQLHTQYSSERQQGQRPSGAKQQLQPQQQQDRQPRRRSTNTDNRQQADQQPQRSGDVGRQTENAHSNQHTQQQQQVDSGTHRHEHEHGVQAVGNGFGGQRQSAMVHTSTGSSCTGLAQLLATLQEQLAGAAGSVAGQHQAGAAAAHNPNSPGSTEGSSAGAGGQQQQHHSSRRTAGSLTGCVEAALASSGGVEPSEAVRASIRRVERAALLEKIKLLQQH